MAHAPSNSDSEESSDSDQNDEDSGDENTGFKESKEGDAESENTSFAELLRALRCSRASVIASATELLMDVIAPDFALAVLSPHHTTRREALERAFESIDRELVRMDSALAAGAFRLVAQPCTERRAQRSSGSCCTVRTMMSRQARRS